MKLTADGESLAPELTQTFDTLAKITARRFVGDARPVRIIALDSFISEWLLSRLQNLSRANPAVRLRFVAANREIDFLAIGDADLEIRYGEGGWRGFEVRKLFTEEIFPVCSPGLLQAHGPVKALDDLHKFPLLHDATCISWRDFINRFCIDAGDPERGIGFDHSHLVIEACVAGHGVALGRGLLVADAIHNGLLIRPWRESEPAEFGYHLVYRKDLEHRPSIRRVVDWLCAEARAFNATAGSASSAA